MFYTEEIINQFVTESRTYLDTIEDDLYDVARHKHNPDALLVNQVFRVFHTIKEGAAFLGLKNINDLARVMENMLAMIHAAEIIPDSPIIAALLEGADTLNTLLDDVSHSNDTDIATIYKKLSDLLSGEISPQVRKELDTNVALPDLHGEKTGFEINRFTLKNLNARNKFLYVLKFDLMDLSGCGSKTPLQLIRKLHSKGEIIEGRLKAVLEDLYTGLPRQPLIYEVLYAAGLDLKQLQEITGLPADRISIVKLPLPENEACPTPRSCEIFREMVLPQICERCSESAKMSNIFPKQPIRIWNVGTANGLEAYKLAALVSEYIEREHPRLSPGDIALLTSDVSAEKLAKAILGKYSDEELNNALSPGEKPKYFSRAGAHWLIRDDIRALIDFRQICLLPPYPFFTQPGAFDVIICHESLKSPSGETYAELVEYFYSMLAENGYIFPPHDENLSLAAGKFEPVEYGETIIYKKAKEVK